jgi:hypothetical protein
MEGDEGDRAFIPAACSLGPLSCIFEAIKQLVSLREQEHKKSDRSGHCSLRICAALHFARNCR